MFLDIADLNEAQTDMALGFIYKALHGHEDDEAIWDKHPSPMVRRLVELFSSRGLARLASVQTEIEAWMEGQRHVEKAPLGLIIPPAGPPQRWTEAELELVRIYLEALPPAQWTLDDHMLMVDFVLQRYMPENELKTEAEWLTVRSSMMGKLQAALGEMAADKVDELIPAMPATLAGSNLTGLHEAITEFAVNRAAEHVTSLADGVRHHMRGLIARRVERTLTGDLGGPSLHTELVDAFAVLNRDWRRIAVTEATEALGQGFIASRPLGSKVKRVEQYRNACTWCRKIDGMEFTVVEPGRTDKDGDTQVWVGKTNVGRSSAPRKRVGNTLVEREPHELWWPAAGAQHPHCRGRWLPVVDYGENTDPDFAAWLRLTLKKPAEGAPA